MRLRGRRVLVVGASAGLGRAVARRLALAGAELGLFARRRGLLESLAAEVRSRGGSAEVLAGDARRDADVDAALARFTAAAPLDALVVMAGTSHVSRPDAPSTEEAREVMEANYLAVVRWIERVVPGMVARGEGLVCAATALCAYRGIPCGEDYAASKAALKVYLESLGVDLAPLGVEVVQVMPGFVDTPMSRRNNFTQPFMISAEDAAERVVRGLERGRPRVELGVGMSWLMGGLRLLPDGLYARLFRGFARRRAVTARILDAAPPLLCPDHEQPLVFDRYGSFDCPECGTRARFERDHLDWVEGRVGEEEGSAADARMGAAYRVYSLAYPALAYLAMRGVWRGELGPLVSFYRERLEDAARHAPVALDVATGDGSLLRLALRGVPDPPALLCVDLSRDMLAKASRRLADRAPVLLLRQDARRLNLPEGSFPRILCFGGVHVFTDPVGCLRRLRALLAPGGEVAGSILTRPPHASGRRWSDRFVSWGSLSNSLSEEEIEEVFADAGLGFAEKRWNGSMLLFVARAEGG